MSKTIFVLHERSTKEHFIALETYAKTNNIHVKYREFLIARYVIKSIVKLDFSLLIQQVKNLLFLTSLLFSSKKNIVLGIAPLDTHLPILKRFLSGHSIFYMTSWGDWSGQRFPKNKRSNSEYLQKAWQSFLENDIKGVFCVTQSALDNLKANYHIKVPTVVVSHAINNSVKLEKIPEIAIKKETIQMIYVGRLVDTKGIHELIQLMKKLDSEKYVLRIIGDGPLRKEVEEASNTYSNILYLGYIENKKELFKLYSESDLQLLFSKKSELNYWEELFGMVIIEAMYCGLITIATNHIGPKSIIENNIDGFLINENNMVEETLEILNNSTFMHFEMKSSAKKTAEKFYKENLAKKWAEILDHYI